MRIKHRYLLIISSLLILFTLGWLSKQLFTPLPLQLVKMEISGYVVFKIPEGVEVVHHNWVHPKNRIELTFNKEIDPKQETEFLLFQNGESVGNVYPEHVPKESVLPLFKSEMWKAEGKKLIIQPVYPERGLHMFFVTLVIPAELEATDGTTLISDNLIFLSSMRPYPQSLVEVGLREGSPLSLLVSGKDDGRTIAYLLEDTPLFSNPHLQSSSLTELVSGENVEVIETEEKWSKVKVYYPKYAYSDPAMDSLPANFDVWNSDLVKTVIGYIPAHILQAIPRPRNPTSFVIVNYDMTGHDNERKVICVGMNTSVASSSGSLAPGERLTQEQVDYLEVFTLWRFSYYTAGRSYTLGAQYTAHGSITGHNPKHPGHSPQYRWSEEQYNLYLRIRQTYIDELDRYWQEFQVAPKPKYQKWKEEYHQAFKKEVKMQDIWIKWGRIDKELKLETLIDMITESFGQTSEEKEKIANLIIQQSKSYPIESPGLTWFYNNYLLARPTIDEGVEEGKKLFTEQW